MRAQKGESCLYNLIILAALAASPPRTASAEPPAVALSASAEKDLQCVTLGLVAAGTEKDQTKLQAAIAAAWYFLGRLDIEAPYLDLKRETSRALGAMNGDPRTRDIGAACDAQFAGRGDVLVKMGRHDQK
jgi:hypothetical protein